MQGTVAGAGDPKHAEAQDPKHAEAPKLMGDIPE